MAKYIVTGTTDRSRSGTEEVIFEKDEAGNPTRYISTTRAENLTEEDIGLLNSLGVTFEEVSDDQAAALEEDATQLAAASDTAGAAPTFGEKPEGSTGKKKSAGGSSGGGK